MGDIKALTEVVDVVLTGLQIYQQSMADGKINANDLGLLLQLVPVVGPAVTDISLIPSELSALSDADAEALVAHVVAKLSLGTEHATLVVEKALKLAVDGFELYAALKTPPAPAPVAPTPPAAA